MNSRRDHNVQTRADGSPPSHAPEMIPCPYCGEDTFELLFEAHDRLHHKPGVFGVVRCLQCGGIFTNPRPTMADFDIYYPGDYGPHLQKPPSPTKSDRALRRLVSAAFHWYMRPYDTIDLPLEPGHSLLELGCASGAYLLKQQERGLTVRGVEFAAEPSQFAREHLHLDVFTGQLEDAAFADASFDGVAAWMVLEHVPSPAKTLDEIHRILKPTGWLAFSVPNAGSWEFSMFQQDWYSLDVPRHCSHFSIPFLSRLLQEHGFTVERIYHQRNIDSILGSIGNRLISRGHTGSMARAWADFPSKTVGPARFVIRPLLQPLAWLFAALRQSGRITVLARAS